MSSLRHDNLESFDLEQLQDIVSVRFRGEETSIIDAMDQILAPQYELVTEYPDLNEESDIDMMGDDDKAEVLNLSNQLDDMFEEGFEIDIRDTNGDLRTFKSERINDYDPRFTNSPYSSVAMISNQDEVMGLKIARDYNDLDLMLEDKADDVQMMPDMWKKADFSPDDVDTDNNFLVQEIDYLMGMEDVNRELNRINPYVSVFPDNFVFAEQNNSPKSDISDRDVAVLYDWAEPVAEEFANPSFSDEETKQDLEQRARQIGRYAATLDELGIYRHDRDIDEVMVSSEGDLFEVDREMIVYSPDVPGNNRYELITRMITDRPDVDRRNFDARSLEEIAKEEYDRVRATDEDLSKMFPENLKDWKTANVEEDKFLDCYWDPDSY